MKTPSNELFQLIKSLDSHEKGYFKVYASRKVEHNSYIKLFDAIDRQLTYDEVKLKKKLKNTMLMRNLKRFKSYTTEAILNSLREYHSTTSVNAELQKFILQAEVLIKKKLITLAKKILLKAEKLAMNHDIHDYSTAIYSLKDTMLRSTMNIEDLEIYLNNGALKERQHLECLKNTIEFRNLASQVQLISANSYSIEAKERYLNKIKSILNSSLLSSPDKALSFTALKDYYSIHFFCSKLLDKWDRETYQRQEEWLTYLESDKEKLAERTHIYLSALINLMLIQYHMGSSNETERTYEKINRFYFSLHIKKRTKALLAGFVNVTSNYMGIQLENGHPEKSLKAWQEIKSSIFLNKLDLNLFLAICNNLSHIYFMLGNYQDALKWANKILNFREKNLLDAQAMSRIYVLLVHYELGNYDMLPYMARSSKRFLVKHNYFSQFEKIMIHFFEREIPETNKGHGKIEVFRKLKTELEVLLKNTKQIRALEHFAHMSWIESKIENKPFVEIVKSRHSPNGRIRPMAEKTGLQGEEKVQLSSIGK